MFTIPQLVAQALGAFLTSETKDRFGSSHARLAELLPFAAKLTLECIGNSDALYHNIEHSLLVSLAGHDILMGRSMLRVTTASDYGNFMLACLVHDIGYVRGIVQGDDNDSYVADLSGRKVHLPRGSSDAALAPYHVDRSKLFVFERLDVGDSSRVVDAHVHEFPSDAAIRLPGIVGDSFASSCESTEFLDVDVHQFARSLFFVATHDRPRIEIAEP